MPRPKSGPSLAARLMEPLLDLNRLFRDPTVPAETKIEKAAAFVTSAIEMAAKADPTTITMVVRSVRPEPTPENSPEPTPENSPEPTPENSPEPTPENSPEPAGSKKKSSPPRSKKPAAGGVP